MNRTEKEIQDVLGKGLYQSGHFPITFNFEGEGLGECDIISISKADLIYEYEIKVSKSDFKNDFIKKQYKHRNLLSRNGTKVYEHRIWRKGKVTKTFMHTLYHIANYFNYVTPKGLLNVADIPEYAGLIEVDESGKYEVIKKAPKLHDVKATPGLIKSIAKNLTSKLVFGCAFMTYKRNLKKNG